MRAFLENQTAENVHDLRTASRRLLACLLILPGTVRKKRKVEEFSATLDELIKRNAAVRDIDIISSKISNRSDRPVPDELLARLENQRVKSLKPGLRLAAKIRRLKAPRIQMDKLSDALLQERLDKVNRKLEARIRDRLPTVLGDPAEKRELHRLREDSRRLRYVLDLGGTSPKSEPMPLLRSWQDILGLIHDSDIMIDYLQREKPSPEIQELLRSEVSERNSNYERFASMATTKLALKLSEQR